MNSLRVLVVAAPLALVASASAQTVQLRFKPPIGKSFSYKTTMSMNMSGAMMPGGSMAMTQSVPTMVKALSRTGNLTKLETKTGQVKVTLPASSPMAGMKAQIEKSSSNKTSTTTVDEFGGLKGVAAKGGAPDMGQQMGASMMQGAQGVTYPTKALKVGDTWSGSLDMSKMSGSMPGGMNMSGKFPIVYKLTALKGNLATISVTMKGSSKMAMGANSMTMTMNSVSSMIVDRTTGMLQSMTSTLDNNMAMGAAGSMKQRMVMTMKQG